MEPFTIVSVRQQQQDAIMYKYLFHTKNQLETDLITFSFYIFQTKCKTFKFTGKSSCKWGKNEWCANMANAIRCNVSSSTKIKAFFENDYKNVFFYRD